MDGFLLLSPPLLVLLTTRVLPGEVEGTLIPPELSEKERWSVHGVKSAMESVLNVAEALAGPPICFRIYSDSTPAALELLRRLATVVAVVIAPREQLSNRSVSASAATFASACPGLPLFAARSSSAAVIMAAATPAAVEEGPLLLVGLETEALGVTLPPPPPRRSVLVRTVDAIRAEKESVPRTFLEMSVGSLRERSNGPGKICVDCTINKSISEALEYSRSKKNQEMGKENNTSQEKIEGKLYTKEEIKLITELLVATEEEKSARKEYKNLVSGSYSTNMPITSEKVFKIDKEITNISGVIEACLAEEKLKNPGDMSRQERALMTELKVEIWGVEAAFDNVPKSWLRFSDAEELVVAWRKWPNYGGQDFIVSSFDMSPYVKINESDGIELQLLLALARTLHLRMRVEVPEEEDKIGHFDAEARVWRDGVLGALQEARAHAAAAALFFSTPRDVFDKSTPWAQACASFLAPLPRARFSAGTIARPFECPTWATLMAALTLQTAALGIARRLRARLQDVERVGADTRSSPGWLLALGMLLQAHSPDSHTQAPAQRHLLAWWSVFSVLAVTAYCSSLAAHLSAPSFPPPIDTIEQLERSGMYWGYYIPLPLNLVFDFDRPGQRAFAHRMVLVRDAEDVARRVERGDYAVPAMGFGRYFFVEQILLPRRHLRQLRVLSECARYDLLSIALLLYSPITPWLNRVIALLVEAGVLEQWQAGIVRRGRVSAVLASPAGVAADEEGPKALRTRSLASAFVLLAAGCALATLRLCYELRHLPSPAQPPGAFRSTSPSV